MQLGDYIMFKVATLHGIGKARGRITKLFADGRIEVKSCSPRERG